MPSAAKALTKENQIQEKKEKTKMRLSRIQRDGTFDILFSKQILWPDQIEDMIRYSLKDDGQQRRLLQKEIDSTKP